MEVVNTFKSPLSCDDCEFSTEKSEYTARHVALVHFKLESLLQDNDLVAEKIAEYENTNKNIPKRQVHNNSPLLPERKSQRTFKPTTRFVSEEQPTLKCEQSNNSQKRKGESINNGTSPIQPVKKAGKFDIKQESTSRELGIKINPLTEILKTEIKNEENSFDISTLEYRTPKEENYEEMEEENEEEEDYEIEGFDDGDDEGDSQIVEVVSNEKNHCNDSNIEGGESPSSMSLLKKTLMKGSSPSGSKEASPSNDGSGTLLSTEQQGKSTMKRRLSSTDSKDSNNGGGMSTPKVQVTAVSKSEGQSSSMIKQLPPSISLTPALPKMNMPNVSSLLKHSTTTNGGSNSPKQTSNSSSINPQTIAEVNDSWAQTLMPKRVRSGSSSLSSSPALEITKSGSVSLTPAAGMSKTMPPSVTLTPSQSPKQPVSSGIAKLIKLGSQKHISPKGTGSVTLTPKGGTPAVSAQISRGSPLSSSWNGSGSKGSVTLTPAASNNTSFPGSSGKGSVSLTPATSRTSRSSDGSSGGGSVVKIKRATQAKWQLKDPPGVSVTPVTSRSSSIQGQASTSIYTSSRQQENVNQNRNSPQMLPGISGRSKYGGGINGEERASATHFTGSMHNESGQDDSEREHETTDDEDMVHRMLLEPQVILDTSTTDQVS